MWGKKSPQKSIPPSLVRSREISSCPFLFFFFRGEKKGGEGFFVCESLWDTHETFSPSSAPPFLRARPRFFLKKPIFYMSTMEKTENATGTFLFSLSFLPREVGKEKHTAETQEGGETLSSSVCWCPTDREISSLPFSLSRRKDNDLVSDLLLPGTSFDFAHFCPHRSAGYFLTK